MFAVFTSNSQSCTPPSGFVEISDVTEDVFRQHIFYKIAGGSEPSNYSFEVGASAPLVVTLSAFRGVNTSSPIDIGVESDSSTTHSEPYTTPSVSGGTAGLLLYGRSARISSSTPVTFTASGVTERVDQGVFSGGSVSYSSALYSANSEYTSGGSKSGLGITSSGSESHNIVFTVALKSSGIPGTMEIVMPSIPTVTMAGTQAAPAVVDIVMPSMPTVSVNVFHGASEGPLAVEVPVTVSINGASAAAGLLDVDVPILFDIPGETRSFGGNTVTPEREERWLVITQEGFYLGVRTGSRFPLHIEMPLVLVQFDGRVSTFAFPADTYAEVFDPAIRLTIGGTGTTSIAVSVENATVNAGEASAPEAASVAVETYDASFVSTAVADAGLAEVSVSSDDISYEQMVSIEAFDPQVQVNEDIVAALAGHASVTCHN